MSLSILSDNTHDCCETLLSTHLAVVAYEFETGVDEPLKEVIDDVPRLLLQDVRQHVDPRLEDGPPAQTGRLQVDHATATHSRWLHTHTHMGMVQHFKHNISMTLQKNNLHFFEFAVG